MSSDSLSATMFWFLGRFMVGIIFAMLHVCFWIYICIVCFLYCLCAGFVWVQGLFGCCYILICAHVCSIQ